MATMLMEHGGSGRWAVVPAVPAPVGRRDRDGVPRVARAEPALDGRCGGDLAERYAKRKISAEELRQRRDELHRRHR